MFRVNNSSFEQISQPKADTKCSPVSQNLKNVRQGTTSLALTNADGGSPEPERIQGTTAELRPGPAKRARLEPTPPLSPSALNSDWRGSGQPNVMEAIQAFALLDSKHVKKFRLEIVTQISQSKFYPFAGEKGQSAHYNKLLAQGTPALSEATSAENIQQKIEAFTQWGMKVDIHSLAFFKLPGQITTEVKEINGGLIADLVNQQSRGKAAVQRIIEPMAGSGFYANYARAVGFEGEMIINDTNPLIAWTQREIVEQPDRVKHYIESIKNDLIDLGNQYHIKFAPSTLSIKFESEQEAKTFVRSDDAKNFRLAVNNYFNEVVDVVVEVKNEKIVVSAPPAKGASVIAQVQGDEIVISATPHIADEKAFLAAVFYVAQNNNQRNTGTVEIKKLSNGKYGLHLPLSTMVTEGPAVKLLLRGMTNNDQINYISYLHKNAQHPTLFSNGDGWALLDNIRDKDNETKNQSDLIILSGHFSDTYMTEADFIEKIKTHVLPLCERGAKVIITNAYSADKEKAYNALGFNTFKKSREASGKDNGSNMAKGDYLLAVNLHTMRAVQELQRSAAPAEATHYSSEKKPAV